MEVKLHSAVILPLLCSCQSPSCSYSESFALLLSSTDSAGPVSRRFHVQPHCWSHHPLEGSPAADHGGQRSALQDGGNASFPEHWPSSGGSRTQPGEPEPKQVTNRQCSVCVSLQIQVLPGSCWLTLKRWDEFRRRPTLCCACSREQLWLILRKPHRSEPGHTVYNDIHHITSCTCTNILHMMLYNLQVEDNPWCPRPQCFYGSLFLGPASEGWGRFSASEALGTRTGPEGCFGETEDLWPLQRQYGELHPDPAWVIRSCSSRTFQLLVHICLGSFLMLLPHPAEL